MSISKQESPQPHLPIASPADANDYIILLKPRVMSLVVFTALVGMMVAPEPINPVLGFVAILCIAVGGGASGALNMWYDADIDAIMKRTRKRPIPAGKVTGGEVLAFTIFFYVVIYTMWLKRSTPQNIVIGGAAGAFPPMIGWAAATGTISIESVILFLIIFMWTPPHFWALSLFVTTDYGEAHIPMMPNVKGERSTKNQILVYAILMALCGIAPYFIGFAGITYGILSTILGVVFIYYSYELWKTEQREQTVAKAKKLFFFSLIYLAALFAILLVESLATRLISYLGA